MSFGKDNLKKLNVLRSTIEIREHPSEIMELDEETVAIAKAKLAGLDFENIYGDEDRASSELMIRIQAEKVRDLFQTESELRLAFSSEQKIFQARKDMLIDGINFEFIKNYCLKKQLDFVDDADVLIRVAFASDKLGEASV